MNKQNTSCSYGLIIEKPLPEDYVFGSATKIDEKIINSSGDWTDFLPKIEYQKKNGVETMSCVSFGTLSIIEILAKYIYDSNYVHDKKAELIVATYAIANELAELAEVLEQAYLPGVEFPDSLELTADPFEAVKGADFLVSVIPLAASS